MKSKKNIRKLVIISFNLFLFTNLAILGALFLNNFLVSVKFNYNYSIDKTLINQKVKCNDSNNFCKNINFIKDNKIDNCSKTNIVDNSYINNEYYGDIEQLTSDFTKEDILETEAYIVFTKNNDKNKSCIKNYPFYLSINNKFPSIIKQILKIKNSNKYNAPTGEKIYPFLFGETSISNIAKRFPQNYIFKPALYIAAILMFIYWLFNKNILQTIEGRKEIEKYFIFGSLSALFLILHVFFLGHPSDNNIFQLFRKLVIVSFISFELTAQFFLIQKLRYLQVKLSDLINPHILKIKICFIYTFLTITLIILFILMIYNLPKEFDNFLEWNYFIILSFYYLLTYFLWKKN